MKKIYLFFLMVLFATFMQAQTTLISATGDGGFENGSTFAANGWTVSNSANNPWVVGGAVTTAPIAGRSAYVSNDGSTSNAYTPANDALNYFWRDVTVPAGEPKITLSFNWAQQGENTWDIWQVFTAPTTVTPVGSTTHPGSGNGVPTGITGATFLAGGSVQTGVQTVTLTLPASLAGTTFRLIFSWKNEASGVQPPATIDNISLISNLPGNITSTATGGLWSSPATWAGGVVPLNDNATIADGAIVTVDQVVNINNLSVGSGTSGTLQWNATANAVNALGTVTVNAGANVNMFTTANAAVSIASGGNFVNNGTIHAASSTINFSTGSNNTLSGSGTFVGGIVSSLLFQGTGTANVSTTQNLTVRSFGATNGVVNTNGKINIDNTAQILGQPFNQQVYNVVVTAMGVSYTSAPTVVIAAPTGTGTQATGTANFDAATGTVRSITITNPGSGYVANPTVTLTGGGFTTTAAATAVVNTVSAGSLNSLMQKAGIATVNGLTNIKSDQTVGSVFPATFGLGYTSAPSVGFALPFGYQNLVTAGGSGYTTTPTVTATGGTTVAGTSVPTFTVVIAQGRVVSIIGSGAGLGYLTPPTLTISGGGGSGATCAYPANSLATATAAITQGKVSNFTITNGGSGYVAAPTVTLAGGGASTAATATSRVGLYNITLANFTTTPSNVAHTDAGIMPANRRVNLLTVSNAVTGSAFSGGDVDVYASSPLSFTTSILNMASGVLNCTHPTYAGFSGSLTNNILGTIRLSSPGGSVTRTFPYDAPLVVATGTGSTATTGSTITTLTASRTATPSGSSSPVGIAAGTRGYRLVTNTGALYGTAPTVTMNYNATDALTFNNPDLFIGQGTAVAGPWTNRSVASGTGALATTGSRTTGTTAPNLIVPTGDDYYAWIGPVPCSGAPTPGNTLSTTAFVCAGTTNNATLSLQTPQSGTPGITYQWLSSPDNVTFTPISGATSATYLATVAANTYYRADVTCSAGPTTTSSTPILITATICSYEVARTTAVPFASINAVGTQFTGGFSSGDDASSAATNIGFNFFYKGTTFTQFVANTNGFLQLGTTTSASFTNNLSNTSFTNIIAPLWDDWVTQGNTAATATNFIKYQLTGTAPTRILTVEWTGMERFAYPGPNINFQAKLYETTNAIEFRYGNMLMFDGTPPSGTPTANSYSIGISGPSAFTGLDRFMALQTSNTNCFNTTDPTLGNSLECNTMYSFTPGNTYLPCTPPAAVAPINNEIAGAITLVVNASPCTDLCGTYYTSVLATGSTAPPSTCTTAPDDDVWFKFNATSTAQTITVRGATGYDVSLALYDNANAEVTGFGCVNATASGLTEVINATGLTVGNDYFVRVSHNGTGSGNNNGFSICINQVVLPPSNDNPCGAQSLTVGSGACSPYEDNPASLPSKTAFIAATNTAINGVTTPACVGAGATVQDVWFNFVATDVLQIVTVAPKTGTNAAFQLYSVASGTCGTSDLLLTSISCINNGSTGALETNTFTGLTIGNTYYVRVYAHATGQGGAPVSNSQFSICVNTPPIPNCTTNTNPGSATAGAVTGTSVTPTLSWVAAAGAASYDVYLGAGATSASAVLVANVTTTTYLITPALNFNTTYFWYVVPKNGTGAASGCISSAFSFTTLAQCTGNPAGVAITPTAVAGCTTASQTFTATTTSTGASITYQWENSIDAGTTWTPINTATNATYASGAVTVTTQYRCIVTCAGTNNTTSNTAEITIGAAPTVTVSPVNAAVCGTGTATFTATVSSGATIAWETSPDGTNWTPIAAATSTTYTTPTVSVTTFYRSIVTCGANSTTSATSSVVISGAPANDDCAGAVTLTHNTAPNACFTTAGTTACATTSTEGSSSYSSSQDDDVWYSFTAAAGTLKINLSDITLANGTFPSGMGIGLHSACGATDVLNNGLSSTITAGSQSFTIFGLTVGTIYKLRILTLGTSGRVNFNICLTVPAITPGTNNACTSGSPLTITSANANIWQPLFDANANLIAEINANGNILGAVTPSVYVTNNATLRVNTSAQKYMNRNIAINVATPPTSPVSVRLYFTNAEKNGLDAAVPQSNDRNDIVITKEPGNCTAASIGTGIYLPQSANAAYGNDHYVQTEVSSFSNFFLHKGLVALPIAIESFKGSKQATGNLLDWKVTCTSASTVTITLERGADGRKFEVINAQTETAARCLQGFNYTDATPLAGANYYRLKITTPDGQFRYSSIVVLLNKNKGFELISIAPNPVKNSATLSLTSAKAGKIELSVIDLVGKVISKKSVEVIAGNNPINMNFATLGAGTYSIVATNVDGETKTTRFVKF